MGIQVQLQNNLQECQKELARNRLLNINLLSQENSAKVERNSKIIPKQNFPKKQLPMTLDDIEEVKVDMIEKSPQVQQQLNFTA